MGPLLSAFLLLLPTVQLAHATLNCDTLDSARYDIASLTNLTLTDINSSSRAGKCRPGEVRLRLLNNSGADVHSCANIQQCGENSTVCKSIRSTVNSGYPVYKCVRKII